MGNAALALRTYLALLRTRRAPFPPTAARDPRPDGPLIWACGESVAQQRAFVAILARMAQLRPEITMLLTGPENTAFPGILDLAIPEESLAATQDFAAHWRPDLLLWAGQTLRPALLQALKAQGSELILVAPESRDFEMAALRWIPDLDTAALRLFDHVLVSTNRLLREFRQLGLASHQVEFGGGPLADTAPPLDCNEALHDRMSAQLSGRPVWLAARLQGGEAQTVLRAHRRAVRLAHRLLLIVAPASSAEVEPITRDAEDSGMRLAIWENGEMPDENTQILLANGPEELGLWYRLAPLAFMGGSLVPGHGGTDPHEAALLGSATLYGPNVGQHLPAYSRMAEAGAARIVNDSDSLAAAVSQLIAPDHAATMAHAAWDIATAGASMTDAVVARCFASLDARRSA